MAREQAAAESATKSRDSPGVRLAKISLCGYPTEMAEKGQYIRGRGKGQEA